jgi:hyperosmotically inducible protein
MKNLTLQMFLAIGLAFGGSTLLAQDASPVPADNTKTNQADRDANRTTADQQKNNQSDVELARQIRKAVIHDKTLSTNAHNVKIIVRGGMVTLKGPVNSADEKQAVEAKASQLAGADRVTSELQIAAK